jgi:hypothetical protein
MGLLQTSPSSLVIDPKENEADEKLDKKFKRMMSKIIHDTNCSVNYGS